MYNNNQPNFSGVLGHLPNAVAIVRGSKEYPDIDGKVSFFQTAYGVIVISEFTGLPSLIDTYDLPIFALHIHEGGSCTGNGSDPFANTGMHYNPQRRPHPYHAGDMPPLFSVNGYAFSAFLTDRFTVQDILGKSVVLHDSTDDFTTQPSGNSGSKIACGVIISVAR